MTKDPKSWNFQHIGEWGVAYRTWKSEMGNSGGNILDFLKNLQNL